MSDTPPDTEENKPETENGPQQNKAASNKKTDWKKLLNSAQEWFLTKTGKIVGGSTIALLVITLFLLKACESPKTGIIYPICSAFAEQNVTYPETIKYNLVEQYSGTTIRIYYSHIDSFGQFITEYLECKFKVDEQNGLQLDVAVYNTVKEITKKQPIRNKGRLYQVEQSYIDLFNKSQTPGIIQQLDPEILDFEYPTPDIDFAY